MEKRGLIIKWGEVLKLLREGASFAFCYLGADRFRAFLSLLGVSVGIFSILVVLCAVDAL